MMCIKSNEKTDCSNVNVCYKPNFFYLNFSYITTLDKKLWIEMRTESLTSTSFIGLLHSC